MFFSWLTLSACLILLVGECELDISFLKGVGVHLRLVISVGYGSRQVLVPPGSIHLNAFFRHLQWTFRCGHHPGRMEKLRCEDSGAASDGHQRDLQFTGNRYNLVIPNVHSKSYISITDHFKDSSLICYPVTERRVVCE